MSEILKTTEPAYFTVENKFVKWKFRFVKGDTEQQVRNEESNDGISEFIAQQTQKQVVYLWFTH